MSSPAAPHSIVEQIRNQHRADTADGGPAAIDARATTIQLNRSGDAEGVRYPPLGRPADAAVREEVETAGFVLEAESTVLANKDDLHSIKVFDAEQKYPAGVAPRSPTATCASIASR